MSSKGECYHSSRTVPSSDVHDFLYHAGNLSHYSVGLGGVVRVGKSAGGGLGGSDHRFGQSTLYDSTGIGLGWRKGFAGWWVCALVYSVCTILTKDLQVGLRVGLGRIGLSWGWVGGGIGCYWAGWVGVGRWVGRRAVGGWVVGWLVGGLV